VFVDAALVERNLMRIFWSESLRMAEYAEMGGS